MAIDTSLERFQALTSGEGEPLLTFKWVCTSMPYGLDPGRIERISLPFPKIAIKDGYFGAGSYTYYPGFEDVDSFDLAIYEDSKASALKYVIDWKNKIRNPDTGIYSLPPSYKETIEVVLVDTTNTPVLQVSLEDVWPSQTSNWELAYNESNRLMVIQNFSCDNVSLEWLK